MREQRVAVEKLDIDIERVDNLHDRCPNVGSELQAGTIGNVSVCSVGHLTMFPC